MTDFTDIVRRHALNVLFILGVSAGAVACWVFQLPTWLLVICLIALAFAIISLLGDLGLFGGHDTD